MVGLMPHAKKCKFRLKAQEIHHLRVYKGLMILFFALQGSQQSREEDPGSSLQNMHSSGYCDQKYAMWKAKKSGAKSAKAASKATNYTNT